MRDFSAVQEYTVLDRGRLFVAPTHVPDLVVVEGSVFGGPNFLEKKQDIVPGLAATLLDAGTTTKTKHEIREGIAARGMSLSFGASRDRTSFSGRCFPEDVPRLLAIIVDCLGQTTFPSQEVATAKAVLASQLTEEKADTRAQAERALARQLYDAAHPHYERTVEEELQSLSHTQRTDLARFKKMLGQGGLTLAITGDVAPDKTRVMVERAFSVLGTGTPKATVKVLNTKRPERIEQRITINDKANVDVLLGIALPVTMQHPLYYALLVLTEMLGGNAFGAHLMKTIRDRDGLTYSVFARLFGITPDTDGYLKVWSTFPPERYEEGVAALRREIKTFFTHELTAEALRRTQERLVGEYFVSLSTTANLAATLHAFAKNGFPASYLKTHPERLRQVTLADIKKAAALIPIDKLALAAAGTFQKK